jgi:hypothetical protein
MREALADPEIFGTVLPGDSWAAWRVLLVASQGEPLTPAERDIYRSLTGRDSEPVEPVEELWAIVGRRGGKTRAMSVLGAYFAVLVDWDDVLAPGERGSLPLMAASTYQATRAFNYIGGIFENVPAFAKHEVSRTSDMITLDTGVDIEVRPASFRTSRGGTLVAALCDEVAFWRNENSRNPDKEILEALRPGLGTTGGPLIVISSPYAKKGELYKAYRKDYGPAGDAAVLVAKAASRVFNPSLSAKVVARAYERDAVSASAEYGGEFRDDISDFVSVTVVDACVDPDIVERPPQPGVLYRAFVDPAGGSGADSMTLAVAHREGDAVILDAVRAVPPPFSPEATCLAFAELLRRYQIREVTGDNYAGEWPKEPMRKHGIEYVRSDMTKGAIYASFLPMLNSRNVRLLDHAVLKSELCGLERKTAWGGKDTIDHASGAHDDIANAVAGVCVSMHSTGDYDPAMWAKLLD